MEKLNVVLVMNTPDDGDPGGRYESEYQAMVQGFQKAQSAYSGPPVYVQTQTAASNWPAAVTAGISVPTILFIDADTSQVVSRLIGKYITVENVKARILKMLDFEPLADGSYRDTDGTILGAGEEYAGGMFPGFGLFNLNLPWWMYLLTGIVLYQGGKKAKLWK